MSLNKNVRQAEGNDSLSELAYQLDRFSEQLDPYDYRDQVTDTQANIQQIKDDLASGKTEPFYDLLDTVIAESSESAIVDAAKELRSQLDSITPLASKASSEHQTVEQNEALYLLDDSIYLHVQEAEDGWDYTLYDKETLRLIDGGILDQEIVNETPIRAPLAAARTAVMAWEGIQPDKVTACDLALMEEIHQAQARYADQAVEEFVADYLADANRMIPDPTISVRRMNDYGYRSADVYPLSEDRAMELIGHGIPVFHLFENGTKYPITDTKDILVYGGLYGVDRQVWELARDKIPPRDIEKRFLQRNEPVMAIYQLKETADPDLHFRSFDRLDNPPKHEDYECIYTRGTHPDMPMATMLEQHFYTFNEDRPADFTGHSMSVSDIVGIRRNGQMSFHYCDSFGFKELEQFLPENYLKSAEMSMEDDYGMIDGIINNGKAQPEKKDSVREQLKMPTDCPKKTVPPKKKERTV